MKKRKMKAPGRKPNSAAPRAQGPDLALAALRIMLMKQCETVAQEIVPVLRHLSGFGEELRAFVLRVPGMELDEIRHGVVEVAKIKAALKMLGRLGMGMATGQEKTQDVPATPAPGSERKQ